MQNPAAAMMKFTPILFATLLAIPGHAAPPPNIVHMLVDDLASGRGKGGRLRQETIH